MATPRKKILASFPLRRSPAASRQQAAPAALAFEPLEPRTVLSASFGSEFAEPAGERFVDQHGMDPPWENPSTQAWNSYSAHESTPPASYDRPTYHVVWVFYQQPMTNAGSASVRQPATGGDFESLGQSARNNSSQSPLRAQAPRSSSQTGVDGQVGNLTAPPTFLSNPASQGVVTLDVPAASNDATLATTSGAESIKATLSAYLETLPAGASPRGSAVLKTNSQLSAQQIGDAAVANRPTADAYVNLLPWSVDERADQAADEWDFDEQSMARIVKTIGQESELQPLAERRSADVRDQDADSEVGSQRAAADAGCPLAIAAATDEGGLALLRSSASPEDADAALDAAFEDFSSIRPELALTGRLALDVASAVPLDAASSAPLVDGTATPSKHASAADNQDSDLGSSRRTACFSALAVGAAAVGVMRATGRRWRPPTSRRPLT